MGFRTFAIAFPVTAVAMSLAVAGCGGGTPPARPLRAEAFLAKPEGAQAEAELVEPARGGGGVRVPFLPEPMASAADTGDAAAALPAGELVAPVGAGPAATGAAAAALPDVRGDEPVSPPTTAAAQPGQYQIVGFVVAEVNGTPIYADRVLSSLRSALSAEAKRNPPDAFRAVAARFIGEKVNALIANELEVAAATVAMTGEEKKLAEMLTTRWRTQQITRAGGSVQLAKQKAEQSGDEWDELLDEAHRKWLLEVYYGKRVYPLIVVSAADVRDYYDRNVKKEFTEHGEVTFRLIKIARRPGETADQTLARAKRVQEQAAGGGADFAALAAGEANDDAGLRGRGGLFENIQSGAFRFEKVDKQVWATKPGDVTPVVQDQGGFYVAKVESMKAGTVKPFDSLEVQERITNTLRGQQFAARRRAVLEDLRRKAIIRGSDDEIRKVVDMAMQDYRRWAGT